MRRFLYALIALCLAALPAAALSPTQVVTLATAQGNQPLAWTGFSPSNAATIQGLGAALLGDWDAADLANGAVSSWADRVGAYALAQGTAGNQPVKAAASFNSAYAGVTCDGVDDYATLASVPFPTGTAGSEIVVVVDQQTAGASTGNRLTLGYGSTTNARNLNRVGPSSVNRVSASDLNASATGAVVDFTGPHIVGGRWTATSETARIDGGAEEITASLAINTGTTKTRLCGNLNVTTPTVFTALVAAKLMVFSPLTTFQRAQVEGWLAWRYGLRSVLAGNHPYKYRLP